MVLWEARMKKEDVLAKKTHKQDGIDVARRVYYTLKGEEPGDWQSQGTSEQ